MNEESEKPIRLAGVNLGRHRHVCAFFDNQDQEDKVIIPFLKEGIDSGERAFWISSTEMRTPLLQKLRHAGTEVAMAEKRDQLKVDQWGKRIVGNKFNDPVICVYDLSTFNAGALVNILRTHPIAIVGDVVAENPFFDPPEVVLQELSERSNEADGRMDG